MRRMNGQEVGIIESEQQNIFVNVHKQAITPAGKLLLELMGKIHLPSHVKQKMSVERQ